MGYFRLYLSPGAHGIYKMKKHFLLLCILCYAIAVQAQEIGKTYRVYFTNKNNTTYSLSRPEEFLSSQSIERRVRQHFAIDSSDIPVNRSYLDSLKKEGAKVIYTSRWLNAATVQTDDTLFLDKIRRFHFIVNGEKVFKKGTEMEALSTEFPNRKYGKSFRQMDMLKGQFLHNAGYTGQGIRIAVLDAGFYKADSLKAFAHMREHGNLLGTKDFVTPGTDFFGGAKHGSWVLSVITGNLPGKLIGTAPDAGVYLIHTEFELAEALAEEDSWVAGLEWADSTGADIVSSSLGYTQFEDTTTNHYYEDLDGVTAFASQAASMAARKGIVVVNSAGNLGNGRWYYISVPADARDILTVGAVDSFRRPWKSSSHGPSADGRVKPDVSAMGSETVVVDTDLDGETIRVFGTSLSCPQIAGLTACLWQEFRDKTSLEIMDAVRRSSSQYTNPDDTVGYGIPDYQLARLLLSGKRPEDEISVYPNPFFEAFTLEFFTYETRKADVALLDALGRVVQKTEIQTAAGRLNRVQFDEQIKFPQGVYFVVITMEDKRIVKKVVRD
jgi:hypothetical protein